MFKSLGLFKGTRFLFKNIPFRLADIGEGISEVQIIQWYVKEGTNIKQFEKIAEVQSDKATVEITSRYDGIVKKLYYNINEMAKVGEPLIDIETDSPANQENDETIQEEIEERKSSSNEIRLSKNEEHNSERFLMMPSVRKYVADNQIDLSMLNLSNVKNGKVTKEDIMAAMENRTLTLSEYQMNPVQKAMAKVMEESLKIPHFGYCDEYKMGSLIEKRKETSPKVSMMAFIAKAIATALKQFPTVNAFYKNGKLHCSKEINLGIAVDTPQGLVVPVLKNMEDVSDIQEISTKLSDLTDRARKNKLTKEDFEGATLTISNIGTIGGTYASPVIVSPQVCIVAVGAIQERPGFNKNGVIEPIKMACFSWAADHRAVDGATMAKFSNRVKELIEAPKLINKND